MPTTLTRQKLYDLVWSSPRTALANELGVSDVAINKHCVRARVPAPPAGYWAKLNAGGRSHRPPLPPRSPGQSDYLTIGVDPTWPGRVREEFGELQEPPVFVEDVELQVAGVVKQIGRVTATKDLRAPDTALVRVLAAEARRREKEAKSGWLFDKPHFDEPMYQRQLRIFNSLARAFSTVYGKQEVRVEDEWMQGIGHMHHLQLRLDFGVVSMSLGFLEPSLRRKNGNRKTVAATTLYVGSERSHGGILEWSDSAGSMLEGQLNAIVEALLRRAELTLRANTQREYERRMKLRADEAAAQEARKVAEEARRLAAIEAHRIKVRDEVLDVARRSRIAEDIRATVQALQQHPEASGAAQARFQAWSLHALNVAAYMDPMNAPLDSIIGFFELS